MMNVHPCCITVLAVLPIITVAQSPVPIQFQISPVLVASGSNAVFTLQTISNTFSISWISPGGSTLGQWVGGQAVLNSVTQYQGRITITATQLTISSSQLTDAGNYTVTVVPSASTGLTTNSLSVALRVFDAVGQVSLFVPSVAIEGGNVSLSCSWTKGTETTVVWGKGGSSLTSSSRITINGGSLIIYPANRSDAGQYSCTVSNPISAQTSTASFTVFYGPDTPQVTKSSSQCVGGGDATVGESVQLNCTSVSLPPALLSWTYNGNLLTASQTDGGTLSLQVFSSNQSGQYTCTARNSITTGTSQQKINLSIVGTCLSVGAVAGIVVACFVALILIIIAIVLLLRQRNINRTLRDLTGHQKTNLNNGPPVLPAPQNGHVTSGVTGNGDQPDPPLHNVSRLNLSKNQETTATFWHTGLENSETLTRNRLNSTNLNAGTIPNNGNHNSNAHPYNDRQNSNSDPHNGLHNSSWFPQSTQQNPNILIQTGHGEPGSQSVLINLNPLPHMDPQNATTQPHTVQVSLGPLQPSPGQPNHDLTWHNGQQNSTVPQQPPVGESHSNGQAQMGNIHNTAQTALSTLRNQTGYSHPTEQTLTGHHTRTTHHSSDLHHRHSNDTHSRSPEMLSTSTHHHQRPWDRLRGTPAYPNPHVDSSDSSEYPTLPPQRGQSSRVPRQSSLVDAPGATRNIQRVVVNSLAHSSSRTDQNVQRQDLQRSVGGHPNETALQNTTSQDHLIQTRSTQNMAVSTSARVPQIQTSSVQHAPQVPFIQTNGTQNTGVSTMPSIPQIQTAQQPQMMKQTKTNLPNSIPLTQAALQLHTNHTPNPFTSRNQQTRAALLQPGPGSRPSQPSQPQPQPTAQRNQRPPTPPPVLHPAEFRTLPREPLRQTQAVQPIHMMRQPHGRIPHGHARAMHASPQRHQQMPGDAHRHGHGPADRHRTHMRQDHRSRPRL